MLRNSLCSEFSKQPLFVHQMSVQILSRTKYFSQSIKSENLSLIRTKLPFSTSPQN